MTSEALSTNIVYLPLKTQTLLPATTTNAVFIGKSNFICIDPGTVFAEEQQITDAYISDRLKRGHSFSGVWITHDHNDHCSDAHRLAQVFEVPYYQKPIQLPDDVTAIPTPGHHPKHTAYWHSKDEILIAGDMVSAHGTILIDPSEGNLGDYMESLEKLIALKPKWVIPAHGPAQKGSKLLETTLRHRKMRLEQVAHLLTTDPHLDAKTIVEFLYRGRIPEHLLTFAVRSVESSLIYLNSRQS